MKYVRDGPGGTTWFRVESEAEAESGLMTYAIAKHFRRGRDAAAAYKLATTVHIEQNINLAAHLQRAMPTVWQPMIRRRPVTNGASLFISPICNDAIEGMADEAAIQLAAELAEFVGRDDFICRRRWAKDDIVMRDHHCTLHQVTPRDPGQRRIMHRASIIGDGPVIAA